MELNVFDNNHSNKKFLLSKDNLIGSGSVGSVYRFGDRCFKHLKWYNRWQVNLLIQMLEELKMIDNANLCKIYDLYFTDEKDISSLVGYEMDYYEQDKFDILNYPIDYILDNFNDLIKLVSEISKKGINIEDLHCFNVILQTNRIVVIDIDNYHFSILDYPVLFYNNCKQLKLLLRGILLETLRDSKLGGNIHWEYLKAFDLIKYNNDVDIQYILQVMKKYETPFDFIKKYK